MELEANKAIVRRYIELWNTGNAMLVDDLLGPAYVDHAHPEVTGPESVKQALQQIRTTFPDFHITITTMISERDIVALRGTIRRTHQGQTVISHVMWFVRITDGK